MSIPKKILNHLKKYKVPHKVISHKTVYTTFDLAQTLKEKLDKIAKTLLVKVDKKKYVLVIVPGTVRLDLPKLKKLLKAKKIEIAPEKIMLKVFKTKPGTMTPFGTLHKVEVVLDDALAKARDAIFRAGSYTESLRMTIKDLEKLEKNIIKGKITEKGGKKK